jgi:hypothetical protein
MTAQVTVMTEADEARTPNLREAGQLYVVEQRMLATFCPPLSAGDVHRVVAEARAEFDSARVRLYVPMLVERTVREHLATLVLAQRRQQYLETTQFELAPTTATNDKLRARR